MRALVEYEQGIHSCGFHRSLAFDKANGFTFEVEQCPVCAGSEQFMRQLNVRDEREKDAAGDNPHALSSDGRSVFARMLSDEEYAEAMAKRAAKPATSSPPGSVRRMSQRR